MNAVEAGMARCRDEIGAARVLSREGFAAQAVSRCYYAAFYAAEAALLSLGESRSKHAGVISAFGQLVVKGEGFDERAGRLLRSLYDRRSHADYDLGPVPLQEAIRAVEDAETVAGLIEVWLERRSPPD
ncbi:MAG TPA: HEPN domain-containing protein [Acidimicrobiia bacterium]|nr:HEPN domain-containing protein [Acidimicrobiia bacterium]